MILELQEQELSNFTVPSIHSTLTKGERVFNWPRRDDIDTVHSSSVVFGPVGIVGIVPFNFPQLNEVQQVYQ